MLIFVQVKAAKAVAASREMHYQDILGGSSKLPSIKGNGLQDIPDVVPLDRVSMFLSVKLSLFLMARIGQSAGKCFASCQARGSVVDSNTA